jgi:glycosyltransferase involved in cell wall biosynthesis
MRVALWGTVAGLGGMQTNTRSMARMFLEKGCKVLILSSILDERAAGRPLPGENDDLIQAGATIVWLPARSGMGEKIRDLFRIAADIRQFQPDVLWGTGKSWYFGILPWFLPRGTRSVFFEGMSGERFGWIDPRWLVRFFCAEVVGQSPIVAQNFARSFHWRKSLSALPAFPEPLEKIAKLPKVQKRKVPLGAARAAFFGRLTEGKQAFWLVQQWPALKNFVRELHVHGRGPELVKIAAYIQRNRLQDRVRCFGEYPRGQAYVDLLASYDLTLLPTVFPEGAPLVLLESMACGVPFVANGIGGTPDYATGNPDCIIVSRQSQFNDGVRQLATMLDHGEIDQPRLQLYYLSKYTETALRERWLQYFRMP